MGLFDYFEMPTENEIAESQTSKTSWRFDFRNGDFVKDGGGKVQVADEATTWAQWCIKAVSVERYACLAYSSDIGIEFEEIRKQETRKGAESVYARNVTEALMVHPNTKSVMGFEFSWLADHLYAKFKVSPVDGLPIQIDQQVKL